MFGTAFIPNRPTAKLSVAAGLLCLAMIQGLFANVELGSFYIVLSGLGLVWMVYGIFRISAFQIMFGLMGLILGIGYLGVPLLVVVTNFISGSSTSDWSFNWKLLPVAIGLLSVSYFLLFDKQVAQYRRQLALHFPDKDSLDPKVDNLPDDPINPL
jgi:hypothetical protein